MPKIQVSVIEPRVWYPHTRRRYNVWEEVYERVYWKYSLRRCWSEAQPVLPEMFGLFLMFLSVAIPPVLIVFEVIRILLRG